MPDLATIRERHWQNPDGKCASGDHAYPSAWPCDTRVVLDALDDPYWAKVLSENLTILADADRLAAALEDAEAELDHRPTSGGSEGVFCAVHLDWPWVVRDGVARCALAWNISDALRQHAEP